MDYEIYELTMSVVSDAVKILGPAIITAVVGYKAGQAQLRIKLEELKNANEFKAREKIFEHHQKKLQKAELSVETLSGSYGELSGLLLSDPEDELKISTFVNKYIISNIEGLPFQLNHVNDELRKYSDEFPREAEKMEGYIKYAGEISVPNDPQEAQTMIFKLTEIYSFISHCLILLIEKEAIDIFKPYANNA